MSSSDDCGKTTGFLDEVMRLLKECERRRDVTDINVINYMIRRIRSCKGALNSIKIGQSLNINEASLFSANAIEELLGYFIEIENTWVSKQETAKQRNEEAGCSFFTTEFERSGNVGRPRYKVEDEQIRSLKKLGFTNETVAKILGISRTTLWRRAGALQEFSVISNEDLDKAVISLKKGHPLVGERVLSGMLHAKNVKVERRRLRESIHRVDPVNTALRWMRKNPRWIYSVPGPNSLWHNDGLHKLIRWGFVIHACIDGYSRLATSLLCATNNLAETALRGFLSGVEKYGVPERVRGDNGTENNDIEKYMNRQRGGKSYIRGPSVHNQRIERLHYDTTHCALSHFIELFKFLEENELLSADNSLDLFALHFVYKTRVQTSLDEFREGWNLHRLSTSKNLTPYQVWMLGMMDRRNREQVGVQGFIDPQNIETYGIEVVNDSLAPEYSGIELYDITVGDQQEEILEVLHMEFNPVDDDGNYGIDIYENVRRRLKELL